jgi:hypothetical protein
MVVGQGGREQISRSGAIALRGFLDCKTPKLTSATAEGEARLAVPIMANKAALGGRGGMISGAKARLAPLFQGNQRLGAQKNAHVSDMGRGWSLNLRIQVIR